MPTNILAYPTLEELFGSMDFCSCEHCKSVLSPAAYLVELLQFIDLNGLPHLKSNPLEVLLTRRPDIQHIKLTCENTNVSLPYLDIVNEIMEYYAVQDGVLTNFKEQDIAEGTKSEDLIADPIYVNDVAYTLTNSKVFPYNLPFNQPLETLRLFFKAWGTTLEEGLEIFEGVQSAQIERLGLNQHEYKTLTNKLFHSLQEYFGEGTGTGTNLSSLNADTFHAKLFCRRLSITYNELVSLLKVNFINPANSLIPMLKDLDVNIDIINGWFNGNVNDNDFNPQPSVLTLADYNNDVKQWLLNNKQEISGLIMLKVLDPSKGDCDFGNLKLKYALPNPTVDLLDEIAYHRFHRFIRLWKKLGWRIDTLDAVITVFAGVAIGNLKLDGSVNDIDQVFEKLLKKISNFLKLTNKFNINEKRFPDWLRLWDVNDASDKELLLAKYLRIPVIDIISIKELSGIDPLLDDLETDEPSLLSFLTILEKLKESSIKITDINYLLRNIDSTGKLIPKEDFLLNIISQMREALRRVESENSIAPGNADLSIAKDKMTLVYDKKIVDDFFGFLTNQNLYTSTFNSTIQHLPASIAANPNISFDPFKKILTYRGTMPAAELQGFTSAINSLQNADLVPAPTNLPDFKTRLEEAIQVLYFKSSEINTFMSAYSNLHTLYNLLIVETPENWPKVLLDSILPDLMVSQKNTTIKQLLTGMLGCNISLVDTLINNNLVLNSADTNHPLENLVYDFNQLESRIEFNNGQNDFMLVPNVTDDYLFYIQAPAGTQVNLSSDVFPLPIIDAVIDASEEAENSGDLLLKAGTTLKCHLTISGLPVNSSVKLLWRTKGMAKQEIPSSIIIRSDKANFATASFIRLYKSVKMQQLTLLTPQELTHFASLNTVTNNIFKNIITEGTISGIPLNDHWTKFFTLVNFINIRNQNEPEENTWLKILSEPVTYKNLIIGISNWATNVFDNVILKLGLQVSQLSDLEHLTRVMRAMNLVNTISYPSKDVTLWVSSNPSSLLIGTIKDVIKSASEPSVWRSTLQSINDLLRNKQRDALISYILHYIPVLPGEINTADKLYEYFLIDVQMDSCMKTSRIRMALSSVQLFVNRCLMSLEPDVSASSIRAKQWEWMRRYRVWEANRKVFLYPENWLEPELRDNKSPFYRELEGELLQADITSELAETAYLNYLKKLDEVAKLEIAGMYLQENEKGNQFDDILHVFGRTNGTTRQYYYRRFEYGYWTAWEKVDLNIEGEYIFPIIWKSRLFIFWLNIQVKPGDVNKTKTLEQIGRESAGNNAKLNVEINMSWGEYYNKKWTSPKSSDLKNPIRFDNLESFDERKIWLFARKEKLNEKVSEKLIFNLVYGSIFDSKRAVIKYSNKNTPPVITNNTFDNELFSKVIFFSLIEYGFPLLSGGSDLLQSGNMLCAQLLRDWNINVIQGSMGDTNVLSNGITELVLKRNESYMGDFRLLTTRTPVENQWEAPVFYDDERSVFFVKSSEILTLILPDYNGYYFQEKLEPIVNKDFLSIKERAIAGFPNNRSGSKGMKESAINPNINVVMQNPGGFPFGSSMYGPSGKVSFTQTDQNK